MTATAPRQVVIGLDVGTTAVKASAFGPGSPWRHTAVREYPLVHPAPDRTEQDPEVIVRATRETLAETVAAAAPAEVVAVSVSAGMHGLLALDGQQRPLTPLVTWADARARDEARSLHEAGLARDLHALTGTPVHPMSPLAKLRWFARNDPATCEAARWWIGLKELVLLWLTGTVVTELSSASGTGLLDLSTRAWSPRAVEVTGVAADRLPPIESTTATRPLTPAAAAQVGLPPATPVVLGAADGPLGNVGTGALTAGVAGLTLGTSGAVRMAVTSPRVDDDRTLFCYALTEDVWVVGGAVSNGGAALRWAGDTFAADVERAAGDGGADAAVLDLVAQVPPGSDGLVMLPFLLPERAPRWDPDLPGAYLGVRHDHTRAHFLRAAVEGVCLQMRAIVDGLDRVEPVRSVRGTGGAFRSALWREVMAASLGRPLHVDDGADGTALGAAALGLYALGRAPSLLDAADQLGVSGAAPEPPVAVDPVAAATYDRLRASVPELVGRLGGAVSTVRVPDAVDDPAVTTGDAGT
jgi:gluconokinase